MIVLNADWSNSVKNHLFAACPFIQCQAIIHKGEGSKVCAIDHEPFSFRCAHHLKTLSFTLQLSFYSKIFYGLRFKIDCYCLQSALPTEYD